MVALAAGTVTTCAMAQVDNPEVEANETKATATIAASGGAGMANGDFITGTTTGISTTVAGIASADTFRVKTAARPLGIYRNRLVLTTAGTAGHAGNILGLGQASTGILTTDSTLQFSSSTTAPGRMNQWYGFGKQEEIFYRVTGGTLTTAPYTATLEVTPVTPVSGPTLPPGNIRISTVGLTTVDTDMWVYDSNFNAIAGAGNDDESVASGGTGASLQSRFSRNYLPGTYYLAISRYNLANNQASATDDDFRTGAVLDFPDAVLGTSTITPTSLNVEIGGNTVAIAETDSYAVAFVRFEIGNILAGGCPATAQTVVEGQNANISVIVNAAPGVPVTSVTVNASSINPAATSVVLTDPDNDGTYTGTVQATVVASATAFALPYTITDSANTTATGSCNITVTATPSGACCLTSGCSVLSEYNCGLQGGTFNGAGTNCGAYIQTTGTTPFVAIAGTGTDLSATPKTAGSDDDGRWTVALPFAFAFDSQPATEISVCTNGYIQFGPGPTYSTAFTNAAIPAAAVPNAMVCALWDDLTVSTVARIFTQTDGTAPNQTFTVSYENYRQLGTATDNFNFQIVLTEGSNNIEIRYGSMTPAIAGVDFTVGLEDIAGTGGFNIDPAVVGSGNVSINFTVGTGPCVTGCDDIDFNNNDVFPEDADVIDFFNVLAGAECPECNDIDFNNNGVFPEDADVIDFFNVLAGGECP